MNDQYFNIHITRAHISFRKKNYDTRSACTQFARESGVVWANRRASSGDFDAGSSLRYAALRECIQGRRVEAGLRAGWQKGESDNGEIFRIANKR